MNIRIRKNVIATSISPIVVRFGYVSVLWRPLHIITVNVVYLCRGTIRRPIPTLFLLIKEQSTF
jgi:hypothetical protein